MVSLLFMLILAIVVSVVVANAIASSLVEGSNYTSSSTTKSTFSVANLPLPRIQWNENDGYCGEVSTILTAMSFGSYYSQYDLREIASKYKTNSQTKGEYLIDVNDQYTAKSLQLSSVEWNNQVHNTHDYLVWVKKQVMAGCPVTIGVYMNYYLFYNDKDASAGDSEYDHIVAVYSIQSLYPDSDIYHEDDIITFSDHALWNPRASQPKYYYSYSFKEFQGTRRQANDPNGEIYTLPNDGSVGNYAISHDGNIASDDSDLLPVSIETNINYETPEIGRKSDTRPNPIAFVVNITVSNVVNGINYNLYKYNDEKKIPTSKFNAVSPSIAVNTWLLNAADMNNNTVQVMNIGKGIDGEDIFTITVVDNIMSNEKAIYRCVPSTAP